MKNLDSLGHTHVGEEKRERERDENVGRFYFIFLSWPLFFK